GKINSPRNLFPLILHGMIPIGMILLQRDVGSALVFGAIFVMMLFVAGLSWKIVIASLGAVIVAAPIVWQSDLLNEFQKQRILVIFNPELDLLNYGYQQWRGRISLGSGQLFGRGLFTGSSSFVPVVHNDFIFAYIGQVLGFVGCVATAALLLCICIRILVNSMRAKDALGCYICTGVFAIMIFQSVVNIGMVLCVMPVIGVTLPFISCGGTSVVTMYLAMGLVMSVHAYSKRKKKFFED
ncbi:MAG TPA: FtsW/RodA/SpoVE family cell cycle protein, partial [Firmicutes bacterium]|nr:FtsW/RodA/SpoVE family cell cycle protein [Bacillota bacterium]